MGGLANNCHADFAKFREHFLSLRSKTEAIYENYQFR